MNKTFKEITTTLVTSTELVSKARKVDCILIESTVEGNNPRETNVKEYDMKQGVDVTGESMAPRLTEESKNGWKLEGCNHAITTAIDSYSESKRIIMFDIKTCLLSKNLNQKQ